MFYVSLHAQRRFAERIMGIDPDSLSKEELHNVMLLIRHWPGVEDAAKLKAIHYARGGVCFTFTEEGTVATIRVAESGVAARAGAVKNKQGRSVRHRGLERQKAMSRAAVPKRPVYEPTIEEEWY